MIPARNEAKDIARTLDACLAIEYEPKEILVVDDSTDDTTAIIESYASRGVRLIHRQENRNGCCGARNLGMQSTTGEIIVLMNADNRPQADFLKRILVHYQNGADFVIVGSKVKNLNNIWALFVHASGQVMQNNRAEIHWSEGFSCRREAAHAIGYIPGDFPIPFCRDFLLGMMLKTDGYHRIYDPSIPMPHVSPDTLVEYWHNQVWRGSFAAPYRYYFRGLSIPMIALRELAKTARRLISTLLVLPILWQSWDYSRHTTGGWRDLPGLLWVSLVQDIALTTGGFKGLIGLVQNRRVARG